MEELKDSEIKALISEEEENNSVLNVQFLITTIILQWKWIVLSLIICVGSAAFYLRYATPMYSVSSQMLIKSDENSGRRGNAIQNMQNLGMMSNTSGFDNELLLLKSKSLAREVVTDLKLYTSYYFFGKLREKLAYRNQPVNVEMDLVHVNTLASPVTVEVERVNNNYNVSVSFNYNGALAEANKQNVSLPVTIRTKLGVISVTPNGSNIGYFKSGEKVKAVIQNPDNLAGRYAGGLSVEPASKTTTIARLSLIDESPQRGVDYLKQLAIVYNRQANEDKNEIAVRTEEFINSRVEKIDNELGSTDGAIETYKRQNNMFSVEAGAGQALSNSNSYEQQLSEANTQIMLIENIKDYMNQPGNKYQTLPANIGLSDGASVSLINEYNKIVLERNRLLRTASEMSPAVAALTSQLDDLMASIKTSIVQAERNGQIKREAVASQVAKYSSRITQTPEQERVLTQIGRQQEVKSGLYLMLLQKREENSISLAATADKAKLIDTPSMGGKVSPKNSMILLVALLIGFLLPVVISMLLELLRYRIEGHGDVVRLTRLPIIADVAVANETAKDKADIVVHENKNNQMEEIFRSMRTNLQFTLRENEKVVLFTSSTSGEGKTFCAANLAVSVALLGKKVILVGLDIRRPRLNHLFDLHNRKNGITNLLIHDDITKQDVQEQILASGVNANLDLLLAGPVPPNPAEIVSRKSLETTMNHLRDMYDMIIIDTAPVGLVTDTLAIGRVADATVFVCRADYTAKSSFIMLNELAMSKKLPNVSIVINGIDMSKKKYGYAYGYGAYGKYGRYSYYGNYSYGKYGRYGNYGYGNYSYGYSYGNYSSSHYGNADDDSIKK